MRLQDSCCAATAVDRLHARAGGAAGAESGGPVKIGVLNDMSSLYADIGGKGSVEAAKMAVEDFGGTVLGQPIEVIFADHQNKPDVGSNIARQWSTRTASTSSSTSRPRRSRSPSAR